MIERLLAQVDDMIGRAERGEPVNTARDLQLLDLEAVRIGVVAAQEAIDRTNRADAEIA